MKFGYYYGPSGTTEPITGEGKFKDLKEVKEYIDGMVDWTGNHRWVTYPSKRNVITKTGRFSVAPQTRHYKHSDEHSATIWEIKEGEDDE